RSFGPSALVELQSLLGETDARAPHRPVVATLACLARKATRIRELSHGRRARGLRPCAFGRAVLGKKPGRRLTRSKAHCPFTEDSRSASRQAGAGPFVLLDLRHSFVTRDRPIRRGLRANRSFARSVATGLPTDEG